MGYFDQSSFSLGFGCKLLKSVFLLELPTPLYCFAYITSPKSAMLWDGHWTISHTRVNRTGIKVP